LKKKAYVLSPTLIYKFNLKLLKYFFFIKVDKVTAKIHNGQFFPVVQVAYVGDYVVISCQSYSVPKFYKDSILIPTNYSQFSLHFNNVNLRHSGKYHCLGTLDEDENYFNATSHLYVGG